MMNFFYGRCCYGSVLDFGVLGYFRFMSFFRVYLVFIGVYMGVWFFCWELGLSFLILFSFWILGL